MRKLTIIAMITLGVMSCSKDDEVVVTNNTIVPDTLNCNCGVVFHKSAINSTFPSLGLYNECGDTLYKIVPQYSYDRLDYGDTTCGFFQQYPLDSTSQATYNTYY